MEDMTATKATSTATKATSSDNQLSKKMALEGILSRIRSTRDPKHNQKPGVPYTWNIERPRKERTLGNTRKVAGGSFFSGRSFYEPFNVPGKYDQQIRGSVIVLSPSRWIKPGK